MKKLILIAITLSAYFFLKHFCLKQTDGFTVSGILSHRPYNPLWEAPLTDEEKGEVSLALKQKYRYFGCGGQCFIFFSDDGKYVIKVFKQRIFTLPLWVHFARIPYLFDKYYQRRVHGRKDKLARDFGSYTLAFHEFREESGLLFVHLNQTENLRQNIALVDRLNITHLIAADKLDFVIQRRGDLVYSRIDTLVLQGEIEEAKRAISCILQFIVHRCEKGISDRDPNIRTNCGFLGEKAIKIDLGRLGKNEAMKRPDMLKKEVVKISAPFEIWIRENHPELLPHFQNEIATILKM